MSVREWATAALRSLLLPASAAAVAGSPSSTSKPEQSSSHRPQRRRSAEESSRRRTLKSIAYVLLASLALRLLTEHLTAYTPPFRIQGFAEPRFNRLRAQFEANFASGWEERGGASLAVYHRGRLVLDLWGGDADVLARRAWTRDTLTVVYSSTKAVASLTLALLVDRGRLAYEDRVADHWPEFAANGKANITVRELVAHRAGLAYVDAPIDPFTTTADPAEMGRILAAQAPAWEPGTGAAYHAFTHGWLLDQLVRRTDAQNRSLAAVFQAEIARPHGVEFYIGLPKELYWRLSRPRWTGALDALRRAWDIRYVIMQFLLQSEFLKPWSIIRRMFTNPLILPANLEGNLFDNPEILAQEWPAANGVSNSRNMAKLFGLLQQGRLLSPELLRRLEVPVSVEERDLGLGLPVSWGLGFMMTRPPGHDDDAHWQFGSPGAGGQNVKVDLRREIAFAYNTNALKPEMGDLTQTFDKLQTALYQCLDEEEEQ